jgi:hypothetical protein
VFGRKWNSENFTGNLNTVNLVHNELGNNELQVKYIIRSAWFRPLICRLL